ncbi:hypothetical protein CLV27_1620 [Phorcysia thermohydrogeniphila]|uniref:Uncharacterized protein n=1 Tax=Phorcysia thermohydrogeniphila TaxID=936138 RepID=A0A4V2PCW7_9BACT|nr:hypothetical protein CLV27_1620 [Phorcysia thermohydrogeniphila]
MITEKWQDDSGSRMSDERGLRIPEFWNKMVSNGFDVHLVEILK